MTGAEVLSLEPRRHWVPDALWDVHQEDLSATARLLYVALTRCVTKGQARPSISRLVTMTATSRSSIKRAMAELESARLVVTMERSGAVSSYKLTPVAEWRVRWTGSTQSPVDDSTGSTGEADRVHAKLEPGSHGTTLGSPSGSTAGSGAVAVASEQGPTTATEARQAVEAMLQRLNAQLGPSSTRRPASRLHAVKSDGSD